MFIQGGIGMSFKKKMGCDKGTFGKLGLFTAAATVFVLLISLNVSTASVEWSPEGVAVSAVVRDQSHCQLVPDGAGGAIITWFDTRSGDYDIYAQRLDENGEAMWLEDGVPICTSPGRQIYPKIASDGAGGAIITWFDQRKGNSPRGEIYAQRIDAAGNALWAYNGNLVSDCAYGTDPYSGVATANVVSDGAGGAIVTWFYGYYYYDIDIYAQRIDAEGHVLWGDRGVPVCISPVRTWPYYPQIAPDGAGGAFIAWEMGFWPTCDIYAQRLDSRGNALWTPNGKLICVMNNLQEGPRIIHDGCNGAIITWSDARSGNLDIYAQKVSASGDILWSLNGIPVCSAPGNQWPWAEPINDGQGGVVIAWADDRGGDRDVYAQRVDGEANVMWQPGGVPLCTADKDQDGVRIAGCGEGKFIILFQDRRNVGNPSDADIYAQIIDLNGVTYLIDDGAALCSALNYQFYPEVASDADGGVIVAWDDFRNGNVDIYAQKVSGKSPHISSLYPGSGRSGTEVTIEGSGFGTIGEPRKVYFGSITAEEYTAWSDRRIVCNVPAGVDGIVQVKVVTAWGSSNEVAFDARWHSELSLAEPGQVNRGGNLALRATLLDEEGNPIVGRTVSFRLEHLTATEYTDEYGVAAGELSVDLPPGIYTISASFAGDELYTGSSDEALVVVFDPEGGFVTGGGFIEENGARKNFGFNVKYTNLTPLYPKGNFNLVDKSRPGNPLKIEATAFLYLVVPMEKRVAYVAGLCTCDGIAGCAFRLKVTDEGSGKGIKDSLQIIVYDPSGEEIYRAEGVLEGGNIQIHG